MGRELYFKQGPDGENGDEVEAAIDELGVQSNVSVKTHTVEEVINCVEMHGVDSEPFREIMRFDSEDRREFTVTTEEVEDLHEFCREFISVIEQSIDIEDIENRLSNRPSSDSWEAHLDEHEITCYEARATLSPMEKICRKALEIGVELEVI